jgi:inner membrane protein
MASLGHVAVGMAAARMSSAGRTPSWLARAGWSALSLLPDVDVIGFSMGVEYGDPWGHRGATHSLTFALALALGVSALSRALRLTRLRTFAIAACVLVSHGLLDTLTDGGLGCALLWPFDLTRYFAPWNPIPVAPIGLAFFTPEGLVISLAELVLFAPLLVYAVAGTRRVSVPLPSLRMALFTAVWLPLVWLVVTNGPVRNDVLGLLFREDTAFSPGYSESSFRQIEIGQTQATVLDTLGPPLGEGWVYGRRAPANSCSFVLFRADALRMALDPDACEARGITAGVTRDVVRAQLGTPSDTCWQYSRSPSRSTFRERLVCFSGNVVEDVVKQWHPWYAPAPD